MSSVGLITVTTERVVSQRTGFLIGKNYFMTKHSTLKDVIGIKTLPKLQYCLFNNVVIIL